MSKIVRNFASMRREVIETIINERYGISNEILYGNTLGKEKAIVSSIRAIYWVILKEEFGMSAINIAQEFNRTPRCLYKAIAKMSWGCKHLVYYREIYNTLTKEAVD